MFSLSLEPGPAHPGKKNQQMTQPWTDPCCSGFRASPETNYAVKLLTTGK